MPSRSSPSSSFGEVHDARPSEPAAPPPLAPSPDARTPSPSSSVVATTGRPDPPPPAAGPSTYRIRLVPHISRNRPPVVFDTIERDLTPVSPAQPSPVIQVGRFTDRTGVAGRMFSHLPTAVLHPRPGARGGAIPTQTGEPGWIDKERISFLSKVVSRSHAHLWCDWDGHFYLRDTGSSSGTFLNHHRLSEPGHHSPAVQIRDGDCIQLGVDYQTRSEQNFRAVLMRVELNRSWQQRPNEYNMAALRQLRALQGMNGAGAREEAAVGDVTNVDKAAGPAEKPDKAPPAEASSSMSECCICLFSVSVCQSLFIAPCSHAFHYKCIRPLLMRSHPAFTCPMCRAYANLEADTEDPREAAELDEAFAAASHVRSGLDQRPLAPIAEAASVPAPDQQAEEHVPLSLTTPQGSSSGEPVEGQSQGRRESPDAVEEASDPPPYSSPPRDLETQRESVHPAQEPDEMSDEPMEIAHLEDSDDQGGQDPPESGGPVYSNIVEVSNHEQVSSNVQAAPSAPAGPTNPVSATPGQQGGEVGPRGRKRPSPDSETPGDEERARMRRPPPPAGGSRG